MRHQTWTMTVLAAAATAALLGLATAAEQAQTPAAPMKNADKSAKAEPSTKAMLRHVVLFRFKPGTTPAKLREIETAFLALKGQIAEIKDFEWGETSGSVEKLNDGFTHCFVLSFADEAALKRYMVHEAHVKFVELLKPSLDKPLVVDYVAQR